MIIDCFPYFNEKELLELRINLLFNHVDKFIITEGDHTHKGDPKELILLETLSKMDLPVGWEKKILYVPVSMPNFSVEPNSWVRERMQRNAAVHYFNDNDIIIVSDCDEIINPDFINYYCDIAKRNPDNILRIPMSFLCSKANLRVYDNSGKPMDWKAPYIALPQHLRKYTLSQIRESYALGKNNLEFKDIFAVDDGIIKDAGWHFTWMGDRNRAETKLKSFLHWNEVQLSDNYIPVNGSIDLLGRSDHILKDYPTSSLPKIIFEKKHIKEFLFQDYDITLIKILEDNPFITTDKNTIFYEKYNDKWPFLQYHSYIEGFYEKAFKPYRTVKNKILEIGIDTGGSISLWSKYFRNSTILGVDITKHRLLPEYDEDKYDNAVYAYVKDAYNPIFVDSLGKFDIIIDDGPHLFEYQKKAIELYLPKLNSKGIMVIEDVENIENAHELLKMTPQFYISEIIDLRDIDKRYDSIIISIKRI